MFFLPKKLLQKWILMQVCRCELYSITNHKSKKNCIDNSAIKYQFSNDIIIINYSKSKRSNNSLIAIIKSYVFICFSQKNIAMSKNV